MGSFTKFSRSGVGDYAVAAGSSTKSNYNPFPSSGAYKMQSSAADYARPRTTILGTEGTKARYQKITAPPTSRYVTGAYSPAASFPGHSSGGRSNTDQTRFSSAGSRAIFEPYSKKENVAYKYQALEDLRSSRSSGRSGPAEFLKYHGTHILGELGVPFVEPYLGRTPAGKIARPLGSILGGLAGPAGSAVAGRVAGGAADYLYGRYQTGVRGERESRVARAQEADAELARRNAAAGEQAFFAKHPEMYARWLENKGKSRGATRTITKR